MEEEKTIDACFDIPDSRDWDYEEVVGNTDEASKKEIPEFTRFDQTKDKRTKMACTRYALRMISNIQNIQESRPIDQVYPEIDPIRPRLEFLKIDPRAEQNGATLISSLSQIKRDGLIEGYARVPSIQCMEQALDRGDYILTGLRGYKVTKAGDKAIYSFPGNGAGHAIMFYKYDKDFWIGCDSVGGLDLYVRKADTDKLFTRYAVIDKKDLIAEYKKKKLIKDIMQMNSDLWKKYQELGQISSSPKTDNMIKATQTTLNGNNNYFRSVGF